jgi:Flp pilus assembly protein TadD
MKLAKLHSPLAALMLGGMISITSVPALLAVENDADAAEDYVIVDSDSLLGSYLAGRIARSVRDNESAAEFYREALEKDPESTEILEEAFQLKVATGDFTSALKLGQELAENDSDNKISSLFLGIAAFKQKDYDAAEGHFITAGAGPIAELTSRLSRAWMALEQGLPQLALEIIDDVKSPQTPGAQQIEQIHQAMISDLGGMSKEAGELYKTLYEKNRGNIRLSVAYARHAAHGGDVKLARSILKPHLEASTPNPLVEELSQELDAGKTPSLAIAKAADGLAEVFQGVGEALGGDRVIDAGQIYLQLALFVSPDHPLANYALGELYDQSGSYQLAADRFAKLSQTSPFWLNAQLRQAYALSSLDKPEEAKAILKNLIKVYPDDMRPYYTMGNILRGNKEFSEGIGYYTKAIERLGKEERSQWSLYYARGVCYERSGEWANAEKDLTKALELDPEQELVMNYLGYSWVDQNMHLKKAMRLIEQAVEKKPSDGYFVDSLGWAHYRQNEFKDAVTHLERAVELKPADPVINDHLGDAYWQVGRRLEASFQWNQALSLKPDPEDEAKIREKLEKGLIEDTTTRAALDKGVDLPPRKAKE